MSPAHSCLYNWQLTAAAHISCLPSYERKNWVCTQGKVSQWRIGRVRLGPHNIVTSFVSVRGRNKDKCEQIAINGWDYSCLSSCNLHSGTFSLLTWNTFSSIWKLFLLFFEDFLDWLTEDLTPAPKWGV